MLATMCDMSYGFRLEKVVSDLLVRFGKAFSGSGMLEPYPVGS